MDPPKYSKNNPFEDESDCFSPQVQNRSAQHFWSPEQRTPQRYESASSELSPLLPDDLSRGYQSTTSPPRRRIMVPKKIFTGSFDEPSPYRLKPLQSRRKDDRLVMKELASGEDHHQPNVHMEYKYILLEDLGTAASWLILVLPYATFLVSVVLLYIMSFPVATLGSVVTALRISCFFVTFFAIVFWVRKMEMLRYFFTKQAELYWWENPWVLFPERYYIFPLLVSSLLVFEPILVVIYFVPTLGTQRLFVITNALSGIGIQACSLIYLCLIEGFRYHTGDRSKKRAELQRKVLQLRKALTYVGKEDHRSDKVVQNYYDEFGDVDGSAFQQHLRLPNDPCADIWADFLLPKLLLFLVGVFSATLMALGQISTGEAKTSNLYTIGSILYGITLSAWTLLTIGALYTTGETLKKEPFLGTRPAQLAYRILFAHSGLAIVGLGIASMEYFVQIKDALEYESIVNVLQDGNDSLVEHTSFPGMFGRLVCLTAQVVITAFIFLPPHTMDFDKEETTNELTELEMLNKNRTDKRLVVDLAKHSKTWRIFPCPIENLDEGTSPYQDNIFQLYKDFHTDRDTQQRGIVSIGPYIPVFCAELACWLNEASWQAYNCPMETSSQAEESKVVWMRLDLIGLQLEGYVYDERTSTQAFVATNSASQVDGEEDSVIVVSFRGTSDATNIKTDLRVRQVPLYDQITGIGGGTFCIYPDRFEINDADGWIWDTNPQRDDIQEHIKCVNCWTETTEPCTPSHSSAIPQSERKRTYSVGGFDGKVSKETADILKGAPIARNTFPMVHEGFQDAYSEIRKKLFELLLPVLHRQLAKSIKSTKGGAKHEPLALPKIYCTGHSLGGSLAQLFALDLASNCEIVLPVEEKPSPTPLFSFRTPSSGVRDARRFFQKSPSHKTSHQLRLQPPIGVYTYGQPRVGNKAFSRLYKQKVPHSFRVVNEGDAITTIPNYFWCGGLYKHAGLEVILDAGMTGNVLVGPTVVETLFRFHKVRTNVMAHQVERYRECLECIFDESQLLEYCRNHNISYEDLRQCNEIPRGSFGSNKRDSYRNQQQQQQQHTKDRESQSSNQSALDWYL